MPTRIYHIAATLFFVLVMGMIALMCMRAPFGGLSLFGLTLFPDHGFTSGFLAALARIGLDEGSRVTVLGLVGSLNLAVAGILVFAIMFLGFGEAPEQRESRGFYQVSAALAAAAAALVGLASLAAGQANAMLLIQGVLFFGLVATYATFEFGLRSAAYEDVDIDAMIAGSAASQAAFTAQLLSLSRRDGGR